jgi:hypothetical protein
MHKGIIGITRNGTIIELDDNRNKTERKTQRKYRGDMGLHWWVSNFREMYSRWHVAKDICI